MTLAVLKLGYMLERPCSREIEELKNLALLPEREVKMRPVRIISREG
jgi:hypothetical protein